MALPKWIVLFQWRFYWYRGDRLPTRHTVVAHVNTYENRTNEMTRTVMWWLTLNEFTVCTFFTTLHNFKTIVVSTTNPSRLDPILILLALFINNPPDYHDILHTPPYCTILDGYVSLFSVKLVRRIKNWCHRQVVIANENDIRKEERWWKSWGLRMQGTF